MVSSYSKTLLLIPEELDKRLKEHAGLRQETMGHLLYRTKIEGGVEYKIVDAIYMITVGTEDSLEPDKSVRQPIVDDFLRRHRDYQSVENHHHPSGTLRFSKADMEYYRYKLKENPGYIGMITTKDGYKIAKKNSGESHGDFQSKVVLNPQTFMKGREKYTKR